jgi:eukaryotic-like serine/threonine-protein kinase
MSTRYEAITKVATGGMGTVFVATAKGKRSPLLAIKVPHAHLMDDADARRAIVREAQIASRVIDMHVVPIIDVDQSDGVTLVMPYIEGASLGDLIAHEARADRRLSPHVALRIVMDACAGLAAVHETRGNEGEPLSLVHRDVSPQNVLVGKDGIARLADFGLAKSLSRAVGSAEPSTTQGTLKGKLGYLAPETIRGKSIDARVDLFALGVVLWEALAGKRLFRGANDGETLDRVLRAEVPDLSTIDPALAPFDSIVHRLIARAPADRIATAREVLRALENVAPVADRSEVTELVRSVAGASLDARHAEIDRVLRTRRVSTIRRASLASMGVLTIVGVSALAWSNRPTPVPVPVSVPESVSVSAPAPVSVSVSVPASGSVSVAPIVRAPTLAASTIATPSVSASVRRAPPNPYRR